MKYLAFAGVPVAAHLLRSGVAGQVSAAARPDSRWAGVQVGLNAPYSFGNNSMSESDTLARLIELGLSGVELRSQPIELFMGAPLPPAPAGREGGRGQAPGAAAGRAGEAGAAQGAPAGGRGRGPVALTPEQEAERREAQETLRKWRLAAPLSKARDLRKKWEDAGVKIDIVKFDWLIAQGGTAGAGQIPEPAVMDYIFELAKAVGARAISTEMPLARMEATKEIGPFAEKHKIWVGFHNHTEMTPAHLEETFRNGRYNGSNFDIGHFVAGQNTSPIPILKEYHARITHMHTKDRKLGTSGGANVAFGQGDTPVREALRLIRDNKWNIQATVEFEYPVPEGSTRMAEIAKAVAYCKESLLT